MRTLPGSTKMMLGNVLISSTYPLWVDLGLATGDDPWAFQFGALSGKFAATVLYLLLLHPELLQRDVAALVLRRSFGWMAWWRYAGDPVESRRQRRSAVGILASTYSHFSIVFFVLSIQFVDTAVSTIIVGAFPALFVLVMGRQDRAIGSGDRYRSLTLVDVAALALAFGGMGAVTWGGAGGVNLEGSMARTLLGVGLAAAITTGGVLTAKSFRWGIEMAAETGDRGPRPESAMVIVAYGVGNLLSLPFLAGAAAMSGWRMSTAGMATAVFCGLFIMLPGNALFIRSNLFTEQLSVNNLVYVQTVFSLLWLWLFTTIEVGNPTLVLVGALVVIVANVLSGGIGDWIVGRAKHPR